MTQSYKFIYHPVINLPARFICSVIASLLILFPVAAQEESVTSIAMEPADGRMDMFFQKIDVYRKAGDHENAVKTYDEFLEAYPDYGKENGWIIPLLQQRALAHGYNQDSAEHRQLYEEIWNFHSESPYPYIFNIGRTIVSLAQVSYENEIALQYAHALLGKLEREYDEYSKEEKSKFGIDTAYQEGLFYSYYANKALGFEDEAADARQKLVSLFPNSPTGEIFLTDLREEELQDVADLLVTESLSRNTTDRND
ncbi:MAG: hypothetical protein COA73_13600 [Candidatus Hydrogenedentota bacterium]|nr:MAG: hypothetical protein COA73_13600 [Candidatus Hydrogenedentota bacterium]